MKLPSGSRLGLAFKCAGSCILPVVKDEPGPAAVKGKAIHAELEKYFDSGRKGFEGQTEESKLLCARVADAIGPAPDGGERAELAFSVSSIHGVCDIISGKLLGERGPGAVLDSGDLASANGRHIVGAEGSDDASGARRLFSGESSNDPAPSRFVAIADLVQLRSERHVAVWDWKSGGWVPEAGWNWQLLLPAIGSWYMAGKPSDFTATLGIVYTSKLCDDGPSGAVVSDDVDGKFLAARAAQLERLERKLLASTPENVTLYEGKHCQFCPARDRCPAKIGALGNALIDISVLGVNESNPELLDFSMVKNYFALTESKFGMSKNIYEILQRHGNVMDLGDGREAVFEEKNGRRKAYTRKANGQARSNASADDQSGAEGGGNPPVE